ncbi:Autophagy-related protein [Lachnellula occidentalis]|uniref:Autophagy-related protein 29 n=1 Tax=Lachnellula occidentalis TaxID=215460 RepID=A0A8H8S1Y8_9HELO|nr:Autophagy-related protein [Lachnellula occidentalis]
MSSSDPSYTVFIRLPFPRGDFVDPPPVEWDAAKDKALWKILSKASKNSDIDWSELAAKFEVTLAFLLQQAAWLYERQLLQVRAQMRKVGVSKGSAAPSPVPGSTSENVGGEMMRKTGSGGAGPRVSSALSSRKDSALLKNDSSTSSTPGRPLAAPPYSRTSSANTTITARNFPQTSPRPTHATLHRRSHSPILQSRPVSIVEAASRSPQPDPLSSESSSEESSSDSEPPAQSRLLRRPPRFSSNKLGGSEDGDEDDNEPAFMPFVAESSHNDPSATLRGDPRNIGRRAPTKKAMEVAQQSQNSDSSASSTAPVMRRPQPVPKEGSQRPKPTGPLSPRRTAELAGRSPGMKGKGRESSDGTPSMGSSFSDLDDASVTQSALEEALASNMQAGGGMASRMSSISQALRSKYL